MLSGRRLVMALTCAAVVGLTVGGCSTQATSAAQVGDVAISETAIFDRTSALVDQVQTKGSGAPDQTTIAQFNRSQTTLAIRSQLLDVAAADKGIVVTDEQLNSALASEDSATAANQLGAPSTILKQTVRDLLRLQALVSNQPAAGAPITNVTVRIDGVSVNSRDEAVATRTRFLSDPAAVAGIIAASSSPVPPSTLNVLAAPTVAPTGVYNAQPGDVLIYPSQTGYFVVRVLDRTVEPAMLTVADLGQQQDLGGKFDLGALLLEPYAQQAGVTVNPRLGVWDPLTLQVVPGGSGL